MRRKYLLEISVETLEVALAAERGGADRLELCSELSVEGITPGSDLMRVVRERVRLPIFAMIRPRSGDFVYSDAEFAQMKRSIGLAKESDLDGVVLGMLTQGRRVDSERTRELVELAEPMPVTFHRAFDECANLHVALEDVIQTGTARILTSGGAAGAPEGAAVLAQLVAAARDRIIVVPGAGINASNILHVATQTGAREFHSGLSTALPYGSGDYGKFEGEVRKLAGRLASVG